MRRALWVAGGVAFVVAAFAGACYGLLIAALQVERSGDDWHPYDAWAN